MLLGHTYRTSFKIQIFFDSLPEPPSVDVRGEEERIKEGKEQKTKTKKEQEDKERNRKRQ